MSKKENGVNWNKSSKTKQRRVKVIERLTAQLKSVKKSGKKLSEEIVLTEHDFKRINREIETLQFRI